jgi:glycosyltransferase involved in cell wall biosynthesis
VQSVDSIKISIVMPTMNEEAAVGKVIGDALKHSAPWDPEIVVVDSSSDRTPEIASALGVRVIRQEPHGHGLALRAAMLAARGDVVITTDCDDTYPMEYIPKFIDLIEKEGYDAVSGNRINRLNKAMPLANTLANRSFAALVRLLYRIPAHDVTTGMHAFRRDVIHSIAWETNYSFPCELIVKTVRHGYRWRELDIPYRERIGEVTLNRWRSGRAYLRFIVGYRFGAKFGNDLL